ncbi:23S rRNA (pseudouridine(1915)-N(3))-methyltransferase RlmH [Roseicyclus sp. F158]|uniref:Ribosomal RNA large subunit methyltransferase H n=1 Tax=Tropicimonas omnivorans TaxID=3075590 RepID=A0ABU3DDR9_9RHOB|nr:23S rRNA (pseudouridine(1915)-N(3))-methyltransferase RlmH [Roseicyclus sp. F158]MDT0681865.1 23S rRNA (pseudouridine(1915)-N(3))-methyltransferase RlmH [Roseicyclus sp. F158]
MRVGVLAVGRLRASSERSLVEDYLSRAAKAGRGMGLTGFDVTEIDDRKGSGRDGEAALLLKALPESAALVALDERGRTLDSPGFAGEVAGLRDRGAGGLFFAIGGADGHGAALLERADLLLSFGAMVWPHMLARVMLTEQIYRATQILAGTPYHRV